MRAIEGLAVATLLAVAGLGASPALLAPSAPTPAAKLFAAFAQDGQAAKQRPRTRIRVRPLYRHYHNASEFPRPDDISSPGPGFVRQCRSWLARQYRPGGTVIVPQVHCWWARG